MPSNKTPEEIAQEINDFPARHNTPIIYTPARESNERTLLELKRSRQALKSLLKINRVKR